MCGWFSEYFTSLPYSNLHSPKFVIHFYYFLLGCMRSCFAVFNKSALSGLLFLCYDVLTFCGRPSGACNHSIQPYSLNLWAFGSNINQVSVGAFLKSAFFSAPFPSVFLLVFCLFYSAENCSFSLTSFWTSLVHSLLRWPQSVELSVWIFDYCRDAYDERTYSIPFFLRPALTSWWSFGYHPLLKLAFFCTAQIWPIECSSVFSHARKSQIAVNPLILGHCPADWLSPIRKKFQVDFMGEGDNTLRMQIAPLSE